jgi:hypothetical protein
MKDMKTKIANKNLHEAKRNKNDEFYNMSGSVNGVNIYKRLLIKKLQ